MVLMKIQLSVKLQYQHQQRQQLRKAPLVQGTSSKYHVFFYSIIIICGEIKGEYVFYPNIPNLVNGQHSKMVYKLIIWDLGCLWQMALVFK